MSMAVMEGASVDSPGSKVLISAMPDSGEIRICLSAVALVTVGPWLVVPPQATINIAISMRNVGRNPLFIILPSCIRGFSLVNAMQRYVRYAFLMDTNNVFAESCGRLFCRLLLSHQRTTLLEKDRIILFMPALLLAQDAIHERSRVSFGASYPSITSIISRLNAWSP